MEAVLNDAVNDNRYHVDFNNPYWHYYAPIIGLSDTWRPPQRNAFWEAYSFKE